MLTYTELEQIREIVRSELNQQTDDRPLLVKKEFPLREFSLGVCVCGHGNEDHTTELEHLGIADGMCEKCVCKKFYPQTRGMKD